MILRDAVSFFSASVFTERKATTGNIIHVDCIPQENQTCFLFVYHKYYATQWMKLSLK